MEPINDPLSSFPLEACKLVQKLRREKKFICSPSLGALLVQVRSQVVNMKQLAQLPTGISHYHHHVRVANEINRLHRIMGHCTSCARLHNVEIHLKHVVIMKVVSFACIQHQKAFPFERHQHISHSLSETNEKLVDAHQNGSLVHCFDYSPFTILFPHCK